MGVILALGVALGSCCCSKTGNEPPPTPAPPVVVHDVPQPIVLSGTGPLDEPYASRADWRLAAAGDPMNLSTLARRLGAAELSTRIADGGRAGAVALDALAHAPDAWMERARLCRVLPRLAEADRRRALWVLQDVLQREPDGEVVDAVADTVCVAELQRLDRRSLSPAEIDLVLLAEQRLAPR